jgi:hypothetical protein
MRSDGLTASDWAVINEYIQVLQPLKEATKRLEGRGKSGRFGAIYEVIPVFEAVLSVYEQLLKPYDNVDHDGADAPEDHLPINLRAAWAKANDYYAKLDDSPAYYAAVCLHPYYKHYCETAGATSPPGSSQVIVVSGCCGRSTSRSSHRTLFAQKPVLWAV